MYIMFVSLLKNIGYKHNLYLADVNYVCVNTVPDSTKTRQIKYKKSKFSGGGGMPPDLPSLSCAKHTDITSPSPHSPIISHFVSPLTKNLKETL